MRVADNRKKGIIRWVIRNKRALSPSSTQLIALVSSHSVQPNNPIQIQSNCPGKQLQIANDQSVKRAFLARRPHSSSFDWVEWANPRQLDAL